MPQRQPTSDWSDWAILTGLFLLLGFVMALAIGWATHRSWFKPRSGSPTSYRQKSYRRLGIGV